MGTEEEAREIVRLFPDYADTVVWLDGPVDYRLSGLSRRLIEELREWERSYYQSLTPGFDWRSPELAHQFTVDGNHLASRVAEELGDGYEVEFRSYEPGAATRRFRGTGAVRNPQAVAAFDELVTALRLNQDRIASSEARPDGDDESWFATARLSGNTFNPRR